MNLPNKLTMLRIILIPVFLVFVTVETIPYRYLWAFLVFALACVTDYLDGTIARKYDLETDFGRFADPLADKVLTATAFLYMVLDGVCHPLVLVLVLMREFAVSGVRMMAAGIKENTVIAANMGGKIKTVLQMLTIALYYCMMSIQQLFAVTMNNASVYAIQVLCWAIAFITVGTGAQIIWQNRKHVMTMR